MHPSVELKQRIMSPRVTGYGQDFITRPHNSLLLLPCSPLTRGLGYFLLLGPKGLSSSESSSSYMGALAWALASLYLEVRGMGQQGV